MKALSFGLFMDTNLFTYGRGEAIEAIANCKKREKSTGKVDLKRKTLK